MFIIAFTAAVINNRKREQLENYSTAGLKKFSFSANLNFIHRRA